MLAAFEALLIVAILAALAFAFLSGRPSGAAPVLAANGGGQSISWMALASVNGKAASVQPSPGRMVSFSTGYPSNVKNPRIEVLCHQGGSLTYSEAGGVDHSFQFGGGGSIWLTNGGAADCRKPLLFRLACRCFDLHQARHHELRGQLDRRGPQQEEPARRAGSSDSHELAWPAPIRLLLHEIETLRRAWDRRDRELVVDGRVRTWGVEPLDARRVVLDPDDVRPRRRRRERHGGVGT